MSFRANTSNKLTRARTREDKLKVREAFITAGRKLFAEGDQSRVSLRSVAAEAGYAPGAIYQYFSNQQELFFHIRAHDLQAATDELRRSIERTRDPAKRVEKLFIGVAEYWLTRMDEFLVIYPAPSIRPLPHLPSPPFGHSTAAQENFKLYYETVENFFNSLKHPPMPVALATHMLIVAVHGAIVFPLMTRATQWSDVRTMVKKLVVTILKDWRASDIPVD